MISNYAEAGRKRIGQKKKRPIATLKEHAVCWIKIQKSRLFGASKDMDCDYRIAADKDYQKGDFAISKVKNH